MGWIDPSGLWGIGAELTESIEAGLAAYTPGPGLGWFGLGGGQTGSAGWGHFWGGPEGPNNGWMATEGAFLGTPAHHYTYPRGMCNTTSVAGGAFAGAGVGVFLTNADNVRQLQGPFNTLSLNGGFLGKLGVQLQWGRDDQDRLRWIFSGNVGLGFGGSVSHYMTCTRIGE